MSLKIKTVIAPESWWFIARDYKEIKELEALEKQEEEERACLQKEEEDRQRLTELLGLPSSSDKDQLAAALSHPAASLSVDPSLLADFGQFVDCIPRSSQGNSSA